MLKTAKLTKRFAAVTALDELDLSVEVAEIQCLVGAKGAGKTTTISLFLGFLTPTSGAAFVDGLDVAEHREAIRSRLAYVPEQVSLYPPSPGSRICRTSSGWGDGGSKNGRSFVACSSALGSIPGP